MSDMKETKMRAGSGVSFQFHNMWYKLYYEEETTVAIPSTTEKGKAEEMLEQKRRELWDKVNGQVDGQVQEIINADSEK